MEISGISFYDFLGKLIPGTLIWSPWILKWVYQNERYCCSSDFGLLGYFILFVGFYLTGIIWDFLIVNVLLRRLRLRPSMLKAAKEKYYSNLGKSDNTKNICDDRDIISQYNNAYYRGLKSGVLRDLPIMESHENFLKTNWLIVAYYAILAGLYLVDPWKEVVMIFLVVAVLLIPFIWHNIQMKIYRTVWEAVDMLNKIEKI